MKIFTSYLIVFLFIFTAGQCHNRPVTDVSAVSVADYQKIDPKKFGEDFQLRTEKGASVAPPTAGSITVTNPPPKTDPTFAKPTPFLNTYPNTQATAAPEPEAKPADNKNNCNATAKKSKYDLSFKPDDKSSSGYVTLSESTKKPCTVATVAIPTSIKKSRWLCSFYQTQNYLVRCNDINDDFFNQTSNQELQVLRDNACFKQALKANNSIYDPVTESYNSHGVQALNLFAKQFSYKRFAKCLNITVNQLQASNFNMAYYHAGIPGNSFVKCYLDSLDYFILQQCQ